MNRKEGVRKPKKRQRLKIRDIFLVRFLPIVMLIYIGMNIIYAWDGTIFTDSDFMFANSFIYSLVLFFVSLAGKRYHCVWNRAMYIEMMVVPLINYADSKFAIFPTAEGLLITLSVTWIAALVATAVLAVRHFLKPRIKRYRRGRDGHGR